jgi:hypothetical protein
VQWSNQSRSGESSRGYDAGGVRFATIRAQDRTGGQGLAGLGLAGGLGGLDVEVEAGMNRGTGSVTRILSAGCSTPPWSRPAAPTRKAKQSRDDQTRDDVIEAGADDVKSAVSAAGDTDGWAKVEA